MDYEQQQSLHKFESVESSFCRSVMLAYSDLAPHIGDALGEHDTVALLCALAEHLFDGITNLRRAGVLSAASTQFLLDKIVFDATEASKK